MISLPALPRCRLLAGAVSFAFLLAAWQHLPAAATAANPERPAADQPTVLIVLGAAGESEFGADFQRQAESWSNTCRRVEARTIFIGLDSSLNPDDHERLRLTLTAEPAAAATALWLVFIGHGTFDGKEARFNLRGPDLTGSELVEWLKPFRRPLVIINTASASAPFLPKLAGTNRVIITATRSGHEANYTRLGLHLAQAIGSVECDLDKDGQTSLLEAFLAASHRVAEFYKTEGRLATEHALIEDNGDGLGTPAEWFRGVTATKKPDGGASLDGSRAHQVHLVPSAEERALPPEVRARRDALELQVLQLRETKSQLSEEEYFRQLESLLVDLARLGENNRAPSPEAAAHPKKSQQFPARP